ncbi:hypothetical protein [Streptomyces sp. NPDC058579]|uniref:hypothetical protein n=1 Tax=Streptomyces sp. NPDC058579 TaxID=3346548 RepID=UPI00365B351F
MRRGPPLPAAQGVEDPEGRALVLDRVVCGGNVSAEEVEGLVVAALRPAQGAGATDGR